MDPVSLPTVPARPSRSRGLAFAYPDGHQALFGVDLTVGRGERVALLGPNGAGKTTLVLHLNGILTGGRGHGAGRRAARRRSSTWPRSGAGSASSSRTPTTSCSCRPSARTWPSARPRPGCAAPSWRTRVTTGAGAGRHGGVRGPAPAPPLLRAAPPGRRRDRARDGAGDPRPGRALLQPRPGLPPRTRRHPALVGRHRPDGHPRPAVRPGAVPARRDPQRRGDRRRRPHTRTCCATRT